MIKNKTGPWRLTDLKDIKQNGLKVFSCFHCGGGSSMGYKLSGFDVIGGVEIDPKMMALYKANLKPKHSYLMGIQEFKNIPDEELPKELFDLDILDGSPPCTSFSTSGVREKNWGKKKKFREGKALQVLDDLFFDFIDTAEKLQPKIVVAENVLGLIQGNAKGYVKLIFKGFDAIGYDCQLFLLNAAVMGVPQKRLRTIFVARKRSLNFPKLFLAGYKEPEIAVGTIKPGPKPPRLPISAALAELWHWTYNNDVVDLSIAALALYGKKNKFSFKRLRANEPSKTILGESECTLHWSEPRALTDFELAAICTFPTDYNFKGYIKPGYVMGMAVPPYMMNRISDQIFKQWFKE